MTCDLWTVGYAKMTSQRELGALVERLNAVVVDVRKKPISRKPGFGIQQLEELFGSDYLWMPDLGGLPSSEQTGSKQVDMARLRAESSSSFSPLWKRWERGSDRLASIRIAGRAPLILLCQEESPGDCHRHLIVLRSGIMARHVVRDRWCDAAEYEAGARRCVWHDLESP